MLKGIFERVKLPNSRTANRHCRWEIVEGGKTFESFNPKDKKYVYYKPIFRVYFASPKNEISLSTLRNLILTKRELRLGENKVHLLNVEPVIFNDIQEELEVKAISPIVVYRTPPGSRYFHYLTPHDEDFYKLLVENLKRKYILVYGKPFEVEIKIEPVKVSEKDFKKSCL